VEAGQTAMGSETKILRKLIGLIQTDSTQLLSFDVLEHIPKYKKALERVC